MLRWGRRSGRPLDSFERRPPKLFPRNSVRAGMRAGSARIGRLVTVQPVVSEKNRAPHAQVTVTTPPLRHKFSTGHSRLINRHD
jgi:hypothetical protein